MSDCFVLYLLLTCMKKKTSGADKFTNNSMVRRRKHLTSSTPEMWMRYMWTGSGSKTSRRQKTSTHTKKWR